MEKRYQVFISSTFVDLIDERQAALKAILELNHIPAGMELFPATDASAWELIEDVIEASDYYVLIIGGRYGSLDEKGVGFTEKEYDLACKLGKPVLAFLHHDPGKLPREKTELEAVSWERLIAFRRRVEQKHTRVTWVDANELHARVIVGLSSEFRRNPGIGWVRANTVPTGATIAEVLALRNRIAELEADVAARSDRPPPGTEHLAQGEDVVRIEVSYQTFDGDLNTNVRFVQVECSWNELFSVIAPMMISEAPADSIRKAFDEAITRLAGPVIARAARSLGAKETFGIAVSRSDFDTCIVQLRALGLIKGSEKKRSLKDTATYWTLTPYGNHLMVQLRAVRRNEAKGVGEVEADSSDDRVSVES